MIAGLALALGSALGTNVAFLFKQRGAVLAPAVRARHPLRSAVGLFRSRWFSLGWAVAALIAVECGVFTLGAALIIVSMDGSLNPATNGLLLGVAAGVLVGVSDIALKYLPEALHGGLQGIVSEWTLTALAASVLAFYASARGLQLGPGVTVIAFTSVAANLAAIMGGILVFRDPIGIGAPAIVGRAIAFGLVVAGTAFMPTPQRARRPQARSPTAHQA
jgi:hypothetical protein